MKLALIIAKGSEELETVTIADILRRASVLDLDIITLTQELCVTCSHHVKLFADHLFENVTVFK